MCCSQGFLKKVVPFAITFALGLFVASIFLPFTSVNKNDFEGFGKSSNHKRTHCGFDHHSVYEDVEVEFDEVYYINVPPPPPAPPAPPMAPEPPIPPVAPEAPLRDFDEMNLNELPQVPSKQ